MRNKTLIVLIGGPCSGKSLIGKLTADKLIIKYISSGDIARKMAENDTNIRNMLGKGELAPESKMRQAISNELYQYFKMNDEDIVILDGFPRFGEQAEWLYNEIMPSNINICYVLFDTPYDIAKARAQMRNRFDDNSFDERYQYYKSTTYPELCDYINYIIDSNGYTVDECVKLLSAICERR